MVAVTSWQAKSRHVPITVILYLNKTNELRRSGIGSVTHITGGISGVLFFYFLFFYMCCG